MAIKSILEIDVADGKFREFQALFDRYRDNLAGTPGAWGKVAQSTNAAGAALDAMTKKHAVEIATGRLDMEARRRAAELFKRQDYEALGRMGRLRKESEAWGQAVGKVAGQWKAVSIYSAKTGANIAGATVSLLKWTSALGVVSALVGAGGGLFGIERLAASAAASRRQSMASGVPIGQQKSFELNYGRFGDAQSITGNIATAQSDATSSQYLGLRGAGISPQEIARKNAADLGAELFDKLPGLFRKGADDPLLGTRADALGLTNVISLDAIKAYLRSSPEERDQQRRAYGKDAVDLGTDGATARAWQDLTTQLGRAGSQIETTFIVGLKPLAKPIEDASSAFADLTAAFLKSDVVKTGIEGLAGGLETAAKFVGTQEFKDDIKYFVDGVGDLAKGVRKALEWLGLVGPKKAAGAGESDEFQSRLAAWDPTKDPATHGEGIWHRAFNNRQGGHATVREAYNDDASRQRKESKFHAFGGEGGSRAWRNNNPGNISAGKFASAHGSDGSDGRFAHFPSYEAGRKAQEDLWFNSDLYKGKTLRQGVTQWSPPSENDTEGLIKKYADAAGVDPDTPMAQLTPDQRKRFLDAQQAAEGWKEGTRKNGLNTVPTMAPVAGDTPEVAEARRYLAQTATGAAAQRSDSISKLNPAFALAAAKAIRNARAAGIPAGLGSAYRSFGQTGSAYDATGYSSHSYGLAGDFSGIGAPGSETARQFDEISRAAGLGGYGPDNPREWNHKEVGPHLQNDQDRLRRMRATLGPNGEMVDPQATWAASGYTLPKGAGEQFPQVAKAVPPPLATRTFGNYLAQSGAGAPQAPKGEPVKVEITDGSAFKLGKAFVSSSPLLQTPRGSSPNTLGNIHASWQRYADQHGKELVHPGETMRKAAKAAEGLHKAVAESAASVGGTSEVAASRRTRGLSDDRFQRKPMPHVLVQNNTGANVNVTAAMAGATVGYG